MLVASSRRMALSAIKAAPRQRIIRKYSNILRCIGQSVEPDEVKAIEVKAHGENYVVQAWKRGIHTSVDVDRYLTQDDILELELAGRENRKPFSMPPDLLSVSQVLRLAGNYVDRLRGKLIRVSWQDQADKIQSVTIQYEPVSANSSNSDEHSIRTVEEICIHIYKQRKKIAGNLDKFPHRPYVNVTPTAY